MSRTLGMVAAERRGIVEGKLVRLDKDHRYQREIIPKGTYLKVLMGPSWLDGSEVTLYYKDSFFSAEWRDVTALHFSKSGVPLISRTQLELS